MAAVQNRPLQDGLYRIFNKKWGHALSGTQMKDDYGDYHTSGDAADVSQTNMGLWRIKQQKDGTYKFYNRGLRGPLFCGDNTDSMGDHAIWVEQRPTYENNGKERWRVESQTDGTFKLFNSKWAGPLFCGDSVDSGAHQIWVEPQESYENNGKERWVMEPFSTPSTRSRSSSCDLSDLSEDSSDEDEGPPTKCARLHVVPDVAMPEGLPTTLIGSPEYLRIFEFAGCALRAVSRSWCAMVDAYAPVKHHAAPLGESFSVTFEFGPEFNYSVISATIVPVSPGGELRGEVLLQVFDSPYKKKKVDGAKFKSNYRLNGSGSCAAVWHELSRLSKADAETLERRSNFFSDFPRAVVSTVEVAEGSANDQGNDVRISPLLPHETDALKFLLDARRPGSQQTFEFGSAVSH